MSEAHAFDHPNLQVDTSAFISRDARIYPSERGTKMTIGAHTQIYEFVVIKAVGGEGDITMGEHCYINPQCVLYSGNGITFGDYVLLAPGVKVVPTNHAFESRDIEIRHQGFTPSKGGVVCEDDVWVGSNAVLLDGSYIETGAVIAAGSVVNGRVGAYEIWGGTPAKKIGDRPK